MSSAFFVRGSEADASKLSLKIHPFECVRFVGFPVSCNLLNDSKTSSIYFDNARALLRDIYTMDADIIPDETMIHVPLLCFLIF